MTAVYDVNRQPQHRAPTEDCVFGIYYLDSEQGAHDIVLRSPVVFST